MKHLLRGIGLAAALGCNTPSTAAIAQVADSGASYVPGASWRTAQPAAVGLDAARIETLKRDVTSGRYGAMHGVLVVRYGWLAVEHYSGWTASQTHTMQSVSKSVTSLLYGIATNGGTTVTVDTPVTKVFARYAPFAGADANKSALTIRHLLSMRTAMDYWEQPYAGSPHATLNASPGDWTRFILDRSMTGAPGSTWAYNSGAAILVGSAIREFTGERVDSFARRELFARIGVTGETWFLSPFDALPHSGGGLGLKPPDLARIGYLVLRHGRWGATQVVPSAWIDSSTRAITRGSPVYFSSDNAGYGWFWWIFPLRRHGSDSGVIAASGSGGQWLFIVPSLDLVVAVVASNGYGLDVLYDGVLPAIR